MRCPVCNQPYDPCQVADCTYPAMVEGWFRVKDFAGIPTGLIRKARVCKLHIRCLIGAEKLTDKEIEKLFEEKQDDQTEVSKP